LSNKEDPVDMMIMTAVVTGILAITEAVKQTLKKATPRFWGKTREYFYLFPLAIAFAVSMAVNPDDKIQSSLMLIGAVWTAYKTLHTIHPPKSRKAE
jgi:hypothetical protein